MMRCLELLGSKGRRRGKEEHFGILHYEKRSSYFLPLIDGHTTSKGKS